MKKTIKWNVTRTTFNEIRDLPHAYKLFKPGVMGSDTFYLNEQIVKPNDSIAIDDSNNLYVIPINQNPIQVNVNKVSQ
jgi:hypothetical protein